MHWFQWVSGLFFIIFFGLMGYVTFIAYAKQPGATGLTMTNMQEMRVKGYSEASK